MNLGQNLSSGWLWTLMPILSALGRVRQEECLEFEASLGYRVSSRLS